jgi:hypothetical protein
MNFPYTKRMINIIVLFTTMLPLTVFASPTISVITGSVSHGEVVVVNGSEFGEKSPAEPCLWDPVVGQSAYIGLVDGSAIPVGSGKPWARAYFDSVYYNKSNPRGKFTAHYSNNRSAAGFATVGGKNCPAAAGNRLYVSWWMYPSSAMNINGAPYKFCRFTPNGEWDVAAFIWESNRVYIYDFATNSYHYEQWANWNGGIGAWNRMEVVIDNNTNPKPKITTFLNNQVFTGEETGNSTVTTHGSLGTDITGILGIGFENLDSSSNSPVVDFGEIYVDSTVARVEIGDGSTWSTSTHREIQIPNSWSASEVHITLNQGSFADGSTAYLYVIDSRGNVSNGLQIVFGTIYGSVDTSNPIAPPRVP